MHDSNCSCRQEYNIPESSEEESKYVVEEEEEEEGSEESLSTLINIPNYEGYSLNQDLKEFFVSDEDVGKIVFNERLLIRKRMTNKIVGVLNISVDSAEDVFSVRLSGYFPIKTCLHAVNVCGFFNFNFESLNEMRIEEHLDVMDNSFISHKLQIHRDCDKSKYILKHDKEMADCDISTNFFYADFEEFSNVVTDSSNLILTRQMVRSNFVGKKILKYVFMNTCLCDVEYKCYQFEICKLNNNNALVKRIRRRIIMPNNELTESNAYFSKNGQLVLIAWCGEKYYACMHREALIQEGTVHKDPDDMIPRKERIQDDPFLRTFLSEASARNRMKAHLYIADHPEVKAILSYLSKQLLLHKPHKVVHFVRRCIAPYL